jgi:hypothetical protein
MRCPMPFSSRVRAHASARGAAPVVAGWPPRSSASLPPVTRRPGAVRPYQPQCWRYGMRPSREMPWPKGRISVGRRSTLGVRGTADLSDPTASRPRHRRTHLVGRGLACRRGAALRLSSKRLALLGANYWPCRVLAREPCRFALSHRLLRNARAARANAYRYAG